MDEQNYYEKPGFHGGPSMHGFDSGDFYRCMYPDVKRLVFNETYPFYELDLSSYKDKVHGEFIDVCIKEGSDMPALILRPKDNANSYVNNIYVTHEPIRIQCMPYIVMPYLARYYAFNGVPYDTNDISWQSSVYGVNQDGYKGYFEHEVFLAIDHPRQQYSPWHWKMRKDLLWKANGNAAQNLYSPIYVLPYSFHRQEQLATMRRNIKGTQLFLAAPGPGLAVFAVDKDFVDLPSIVIALNAGLEFDVRIRDARYFRMILSIAFPNVNIQLGMNMFAG